LPGTSPAAPPASLFAASPVLAASRAAAPWTDPLLPSSGSHEGWRHPACRPATHASSPASRDAAVASSAGELLPFPEPSLNVPGELLPFPLPAAAAILNEMGISSPISSRRSSELASLAAAASLTAALAAVVPPERSGGGGGEATACGESGGGGAGGAAGTGGAASGPLRRAFDALDLDRSGTVGKRELYRALEAVGVDTSSSGEMLALYQSIDVDGNGQLSWAEFQLLGLQIPQLASLGKAASTDLGAGPATGPGAHLPGDARSGLLLHSSEDDLAGSTPVTPAAVGEAFGEAGLDGLAEWAGLPPGSGVQGAAATPAVGLDEPDLVAEPAPARATPKKGTRWLPRAVRSALGPKSKR
jgi:hypothetical protein